jgi:enterochelin esterase family protein
MKIAFALLAVNSLFSQVHAQNAAPALSRTNSPLRRPLFGVVSPEVHTNRTVTFRLGAPEARGVKVSGDWPGDATELTRDTNGVWSATIGPLEPDIYGYNFKVDNLSITDPANPWVKLMRQSRTSITVLEVPGNPPRLWEFQPVPHGTVHEHSYFSKSLGVRRSVHVYTPPDYAKNSQKLPVLYLFHGADDNDAAWTAIGRAHFIADNLIAQQRSRPMLIVMPEGWPIEYPNRNRVISGSQLLEAFTEDLLRDVMPFIVSTYRVNTNRDNRAIIGQTMGCWQSLAIGLKHRELFAWVGGLSYSLPLGAQIVAEAFADPKNSLKLLWFTCGKDEQLTREARRFSAALKERNIPHEFKETADNQSWPMWRRDLAEFMSLIFR